MSNLVELQIETLDGSFVGFAKLPPGDCHTEAAHFAARGYCLRAVRDGKTMEEWFSEDHESEETP